ncbi:MAG: autotransporter-associated beta strand repeat-containing protein [Verrucomicrobia bacterium]|nr:autotransporter-associated beta strand repeat-containing protein [Verrucomicrobiota bacterium]
MSRSLAASLMLLPAVLFATLNQKWSGAADNSWTHGANWYGGGNFPPGADDIAWIPGDGGPGANLPVLIDASVATPTLNSFEVGVYWGDGSVTQTGGVVSMGNELALGGDTGRRGTYTISGGSLNMGNHILLTDKASSTALLEVVGSGAANITAGYQLKFRNGSGELKYVLGAAGVTPITAARLIVGTGASRTLTVDASAYTGPTADIVLVNYSATGYWDGNPFSTMNLSANATNVSFGGVLSNRLTVHVVPVTPTVSHVTWDGGGTTNLWSEAANWSDNILPSAFTGSVRIGDNGGSITKMPEVAAGTAVAANSCYVGDIGSGPGSLTVSGGTLQVNGGGLYVGTNFRNGAVTQTSGQVAVAGETALGHETNFGSYRISGGALNAGVHLLLSDAGTSSGLFEVNGSGATSIAASYQLRFRNGTGELKYVLDAGGVTPITAARLILGTGAGRILTVDASAYTGPEADIVLVDYSAAGYWDGNPFSTVNLSGGATSISFGGVLSNKLTVHVVPVVLPPSQVLTLPVSSSSTMGIKLSVNPGSGLGTASDTKTPNLQGTVLVQLDDNGTPTQIALRDFTLQPQNNNPLDFNLAWSKPIIGVVERVHATASNLLFYHNNPGSPNPYYPVTSGAFTVTNVPYKTTGSVHYTESGLQSGSGDLNVNVTGTIGEMAGTVAASSGVVTVHLTFSTVADISSGGLTANLTFNGNVTASGTTGDFIWDGTVGGNWSDLHWNPGLLAGPTSGTATATINSGSVSLTSGVDCTGATTITGGSLSITGSGQLNAGAAWGGRSVNVTGGTLEIDKWNGAGSLGTAGYEAGNLILNGGTLRYTGSEVMTPVFTDGGNGRAFTIGSNGGTLESAAGSGHVFAITQYTADPGVYSLPAFNSNLTFTGAGDGYISKILSGTGGVTKAGTGTWTLAANNTYHGNTIVNAGRLILASDGSLRFYPTANHLSNQITGTGSPAVTLIGTLYFDLAGADLTHGNTWTMVDVANVAASYGGSVTSSLGAFDNNAGVWQLVADGRTWTFSQATGQLTLESDPFASWINATWPLLADKTPVGDPDHDGIANLLEYVLQNGDPSLSSTAILPTANASGNNLVFTLHRRHASTADTSQVFQYGNDLSGWTEVVLTHGGMVSITPDTPESGIDEVIVTVPKNGNPRIFGRLKVTQ